MKDKTPEVEGWQSASIDFLASGQYMCIPDSRTLDDLQNCVMVVVAHQDDESIGLGGIIASHESGVEYIDEKADHNEGIRESGSRAFTMGGVGDYTLDQIRVLKEGLREEGIYLRTIHEPQRVVVVYATSGTKTEESVQRDIERAHPLADDDARRRFLSGRLDGTEELGFDDIARILNDIRDTEALNALSALNASGAIFLNYQSKSIKNGQSDALDQLKGLLEFFQPTTVYTHSPFDITHSTHIFVSQMTVEAIRKIDYKPELFGFPVWNPDKDLHETIVDFSEHYDTKYNAIRAYVPFGGQGVAHRNYLATMGVNTFEAKMRRPALPANIMVVETLTDMASLLDNDQTLGDFVMQKRVGLEYPIPMSPDVARSLAQRFERYRE